MFNSAKKAEKETQLKPIKPNKITMSKLFIVFIVAFIPVCALKAYHMLRFTDRTTGFFLNRTDITVYIFYILIVAGVLLITLFSYLSGRGGNLPSGKVFRERSIVNGILSLGSAFFLCWRAYDIYTKLSKIATGANVSLFEASKLEGHNVFYFAQSIFAALGALWLVLYAVSLFAGKDFCTKLRIFSLTPALWGACKVIEFFTVTISYLNVAELFCDIFTSVLSMVFLFCLARCAADVEGDTAVWTVFASGLSLALVGLSTQFVRVFLFVSGRANMLVKDRGFSALFIMLSLFALCTVAAAVIHSKKNPTGDIGEWDVADAETETPVEPETPVEYQPEFPQADAADVLAQHDSEAEATETTETAPPEDTDK